MSNLIERLSDEEIGDLTEHGQGLSGWQCTYIALICATGYDSGSCANLLMQCSGYVPQPSPPGHYCCAIC